MLLPEEKQNLFQADQARKLREEQADLRDLASFARGAWPVLEPGTELKWNWHLDLICEYLTLVKQRIIRRLVINVPPQTMKSRLVNVFYPTWSWSQIPTRRFLSSSYSGDLSEGFNVERAKLVSSEWFQSKWPGTIELARDRQDEIENTVGGRMSATSTGGTATGKGTHDGIVDDPLNPKQAASETELRGSNEFFDQTLRTRLSDQVTGAFVIVMQRLAELDLTGHVLAKNPGEWTHIRLPMEAEEDERWTFPISGRVVIRKQGELLWPDRFPRQVVESLQRDMGSWAYAAQYQQRPTPLEGGIIKRSWLRYWRELPSAFDQVIQSWDMAFKDTKHSSFVVGQVWGRKGANKYLLDEIRARMDFPTSVSALRALSAKWLNAYTILVEDKANGPAVIASLKHEISGLIPVKADISKEARLSAASPDFEAGNVYLPDPALMDENERPKYPWVNDWIQEVCAAPRAAFWDRADACSQAINRLRQFPSGLAAFYEAQVPKEEAA
jgi:predicted phage terminase large subunit-like protein